MTHEPTRPDKDLGSLEQADREAGAKAARHRHKPLVRVLGGASEIADQVPLALVCGSVLLGGLLAGRTDVARAGARMMTAHVVGNMAKRAVKNRFCRTRPVVMLEEATYRCEPGEGQSGKESSFPSGHATGAVAVAAILAHDLPRMALPAWAAAALIAGIQIPRGKHYPGDVAAGAVLGLATARVVRLLWPRS